jgi:hypothetical protein
MKEGTGKSIEKLVLIAEGELYFICHLKYHISPSAGWMRAIKYGG